MKKSIKKNSLVVIGAYGHHHHIGVLLGSYARIREGDDGGCKA